MKKIETLMLSMYTANCYLLWQDEHVLIVDPGCANPRLYEYIEQQHGIVDGVYLTHGHYDHIGGCDDVVRHFHCPVYMYEVDMPMLQNPYLNVSAQGQEVVITAPVHALSAGKQNIGVFEVDILPAPGHTPGSCLLLWEQHIICGDVLFQGSIGRCDLPGGSQQDMMQSLQMIKTLDAHLDVYPGHGESTTLAEEFQTNPYLQ